jgi:hypothetical protein
MYVKIKWLDEDKRILLVERADGQVLLVRRKFPCPHRTEDGDYARHLHFYVTTKDKIIDETKLLKLLDWLDAGFWSDSMIWDSDEGLTNLIDRFLKYRCVGALQVF